MAKEQEIQGKLEVEKMRNVLLGLKLLVQTWM